jgi:C1A family cysteine protease
VNADELRQALEQEGARWEVSDDALDAEVRLGYLPSEGVPPLDEQERLAAQMVEEEPLGAAAPTYPPAFDWRDVNGQNFITPIRDQAECGSCVSFGTCAAVEGTLQAELSVPDSGVDLSEAHLFYCVAFAQGRRCSGPNGGWFPKAAVAAFQQDGVPDEACFPYTAGDQECSECSDWQSRATKISDWRPLNSPSEMKAWLAEHGALVASMKVYEDFQHYVGGVYRHVAGGVLGGHCISLVGYDDGEGFWIAKNSWSASWGEQGFFRIAYGQCAIDSGALGVEGVKTPDNA